jgi:predicted  nucleic acid-binding Zn-ribbon protein
MSSIKLTNEELAMVLILVKAYSKANEELEGYSNRLEEIEKEKEDLHNKLRELGSSVEELRLQEKQITETLVEKYGPFKLNMETFELEPA